ncbi:MAG: hypothetical protein JXJ04_17090 [Spirochaetales bacterium]|nr:hypothetical protein [Spirochaetales bacterium]
MDYNLNDLIKMTTWNNPTINVLKSEFYDDYSPLIKVIDLALKKKLEEATLNLPEIRTCGNETVAIFSDYGGESADSKYQSYSLVAFGYNHSYGLFEQVEEIRKKHKLNKAEIAYKQFGYGPIQRALPDYLKAVDFFVFGLLLNIIIDKNCGSFFSITNKVDKEIIELLKSENLGSWKPKIAEKLLRVIHISSYLIALLSKNNQKIFWMSDNDAIVANQEKHLQSLTLMQRILPLYTDNKFEMIGGAIPFVENGIGYLDFLSIADISAGAIERSFSLRKEDNSVDLSDSAENVLSWLGKDGTGMRKITLLIQKQKNRLFANEVVFNTVNRAGSKKSITINLK